MYRFMQTWHLRSLTEDYIIWTLKCLTECKSVPTNRWEIRLMGKAALTCSSKVMYFISSLNVKNIV